MEDRFKRQGYKIVDIVKNLKSLWTSFSNFVNNLILQLYRMKFFFILWFYKRLISESRYPLQTDCVISDTILSKLVGAPKSWKIWKRRNFSPRYKTKIFGSSAKIFSNLEASEFQFHAELASSSCLGTCPFPSNRVTRVKLTPDGTLWNLLFRIRCNRTALAVVTANKLNILCTRWLWRKLGFDANESNYVNVRSIIENIQRALKIL